MNPHITAKHLKQKSKEILPETLTQKARVAILGYRSTQFLTKFIQQSGRAMGIQIEIYESGYKQVETEILNPQSSLYSFDPQFITIIHSFSDIQYKYYESKEKKDFFDKILTHTSTLSQAISQQTSAPIIFTNFEENPDGIFGNFSNKIRASFPNQLRRINVGLMDLAEVNNQVHILDLASMIQTKGLENFQDTSLYINADIPFSMDAEAQIAWELVSMLQVFRGKFRKCLILDLDNTLWGGVIGDDGLAGIQLGSLGIGKAFTELQKWTKQLKERGIVLAVCSKNQEEIAKEVFQKHADMVLKLEDIAVFVANWSNKADNIRHIQNVLNIGFDSLVFLDDNPAERALIRTELPEVLVPELPADPAQVLPYLRQLNLFETVSYSTQDQKRTQQYQEEAQRQAVQQSFTNMEDYLKSLEMKGKMQSFQDQHIARISQLTQRSNQFNLRTIRYAESDIQQIMLNSSYLTYEISLEDKFGKYGLISVIMLKELPNMALFIETWLMSCRVLKRDVERFALNQLVKDAIAKGYKKIIGEYLPTAKNKLVENHYSDLGFIQNQNGKWEFSLKDWHPLVHFIEGQIPTD